MTAPFVLAGETKGFEAKWTQSRQRDTTNLHHQGLRAGNATDLAQWMINVAHSEDETAIHEDAVFANFDLDGDRGYFCRTWGGLVMA